MRQLRAFFYDRVRKVDNGCWLWKGGKFVSGYGKIRIDNKSKLAHRISWELHQGEIPKNLHVLHDCDNPSCVNPDHLFLGTQADNNKDRTTKGRTRVPIGEAQNFAKLNRVSVLKIRDMHSRGILKAHLALLFKVDHGTIRAIINRRTWRHVNP